MQDPHDAGRGPAKPRSSSCTAGGGNPLGALHGEAAPRRSRSSCPSIRAGGSDPPEWLDNIGDLAYFYLDVIAALGLTGVHLVGTSLGGWIAAKSRCAHRSAGSITLVDAGRNSREGREQGRHLPLVARAIRAQSVSRPGVCRKCWRQPGQAELEFGSATGSPRRSSPGSRGSTIRISKMAAPHRGADTAAVGRRRQDHAAGLGRLSGSRSPARASR